MKATINGVTVEGTPQEIAVLADLTATQPLVVAVDLARESDEQRLENFAKSREGSLRGTRYQFAVLALRQHLGGRPLQDATRAEVEGIYYALLDSCRHLATYRKGRHRGMHRCAKGKFEAAGNPRARDVDIVVNVVGERPPICSKTCPLFERAEARGLEFLEGLDAFWRFNQDEPGFERNPTRRLLGAARKRYYETLGTRQPPELHEATHIINTCPHHPTRAFMTTGLKVGRRLTMIQHLEWPDVEFENGFIDFGPARTRIGRSRSNARQKLTRSACNRSPIDDECLNVLRTYKQRYWEKTVCRNATGEPVTQAIWLNAKGTGRASGGTLRDWGLDAAVAAGRLDLTIKGTAKRLTPHRFRHFFTTYLRTKRGMPKDLVCYLRGDTENDAIAEYTHWSDEDIRREYLRYMETWGLRL